MNIKEKSDNSGFSFYFEFSEFSKNTFQYFLVGASQTRNLPGTQTLLATQTIFGQKSRANIFSMQSHNYPIILIIYFLYDIILVEKNNERIYIYYIKKYFFGQVRRNDLCYGQKKIQCDF